MAIDAVGRDALRNLDTALRAVVALRAELEQERMVAEAWHGNSDDWQEENGKYATALETAEAVYMHRHFCEDCTPGRGCAEFYARHTRACAAKAVLGNSDA